MSDSRSLPVANHRHVAPGTLVEWIENGHIDLDPEYQRDVVWNSRKMSVLIDSFLHNYYIPPVILSKTRRKVGGTDRMSNDEEGDEEDEEYEEVYLCVDGKQRLTSFYKFMKNEIPSLEPDEKKGGVSGGLWFDDDKGGARKTLSRIQRGWFNHRTLIVVEYDSLTHEMEHELFNRVQKVNAYSGPVADFVRELVDSYPEVLPILNTRRKEHIFLLGKLLYVIVHEGDCSCPSGTDIQKYFKSNNPPLTARHQAHTHRVLSLYYEMITADKNFFAKEWKISPVELVMFGFLIFFNPELTVDELFVSGRKMRDGIRQCYQELRFRGDIYKVLRVFATTLDVPAMVEEFRKLKPSLYILAQGAAPSAGEGSSSSAANPTAEDEDEENENDDLGNDNRANSNRGAVKIELVRRSQRKPVGDDGGTPLNSDPEEPGSEPEDDDDFEVALPDESDEGIRVALRRRRQPPGRRRRQSNMKSNGGSDDEDYRPSKRARRR
ncbi:hypothetical protein HK102_004379 [Quaeritorhiza haematococci]|nr:hypothetical protein HK102_004379 [Quaeritorhiza haematococci]